MNNSPSKSRSPTRAGGDSPSAAGGPGAAPACKTGSRHLDLRLARPSREQVIGWVALALDAASVGFALLAVLFLLAHRG